jgi:hypothetical protein
VKKSPTYVRMLEDGYPPFYFRDDVVKLGARTKINCFESNRKVTKVVSEKGVMPEDPAVSRNSVFP